MSQARESRISGTTPVAKEQGALRWFVLTSGVILSLLALVAGIWFLQDHFGEQQPATIASNTSTTAQHTSMRTSSRLGFHPELALINNSVLSSNSTPFSAVMSTAMHVSTGPVSVGIVPMQEVMGVVDMMNRSTNRTPVSVPIDGNLCAEDGFTCIRLNQTAQVKDFVESEDGEIDAIASVDGWNATFEAHCNPAEDDYCELEYQGNMENEAFEDDDGQGRRLFWGRRRRRRRRRSGHSWHFYIRRLPRWGRRCFPSSSNVQLADGTQKQIAALEHGDQVSVLDDAGNVRHESFLVDFHKRTAEIVEYLELIHDSGAIRISANHLIHASGKMRPASDVNIGDELLWLPGNQKSPVLSMIRKIRTVMDVGLHAPLTFSGNLFVDGILVSCYAMVHPPHVNAYMQQSSILKPLIDNVHAVEHFLLYPLRLSYRFKLHLAICQVMPTLCSDEMVYGTDMNDQNLHMYARVVKQIFDQVILRGTV